MVTKNEKARTYTVQSLRALAALVDERDDLDDYEAHELDAMANSLEALGDMVDFPIKLVEDPTAPLLWAVWCELPSDEGWDIAGAGDAPSEAIEEARAQFRFWREVGTEGTATDREGNPIRVTVPS